MNLILQNYIIFAIGKVNKDHQASNTCIYINCVFFLYGMFVYVYIRDENNFWIAVWTSSDHNVTWSPIADFVKYRITGKFGE